ncbi:hypothetical protein [Actinacidiphila reveromycinica]|uniref:hypothetical protein n=1 Tax=Actinacidiphila reveromycinica TaxID=659352 RepID=UPI001F2EE5C5|nr:hypothetical protein [Streptomyces sp. SN-593]
MTNNTAGNDNDFALTPISVPDPAARDRSRRRRKVVVLVAAVAVVAGGISWWAVAANSGDGGPTRHTAVIPKAFGAYTEAKNGDTEWTALTSVNTDISKGEVHLTYRASSGRAAVITARLDPPDFTTDDGTHLGPGSESETKSLLGVDKDQKITGYPAGRQGGRIQCADTSAGDHTITTCAWQSKAAEITYSPVLNHLTVAGQQQAAADLRSFLDALRIEPAGKDD